MILSEKNVVFIQQNVWLMIFTERKHEIYSANQITTYRRVDNFNTLTIISILYYVSIRFN